VVQREIPDPGAVSCLVPDVVNVLLRKNYLYSVWFASGTRLVSIAGLVHFTLANELLEDFHRQGEKPDEQGV
jgi:hypothetical protein